MSMPCGSYLAAWLLGKIQTFIGVLIALIAAAGSFFFWKKN
jgi:hypothetical protein